MKTYVKIFLIVLIIAWAVFIGMLDMLTDTMSNASFGLSYIPLEIRALFYLILTFIMIAIVMALWE